MSADLIDCQIEDGVAVLTLNNPPLNLVTLDLTGALDRALDRLTSDPGARAVVLTGAGERAFCAGSDIREFAGVADDVIGKKLAAENRAYAKLDDFPKPTIAAIAGLAYGGGLELAVCCDLLVVEANARLALPEIKLGVFPGSGGTVRVTRRIGEGRAKDMMYFGDPIEPETALAWGLVNRVVPPGEALITACRMAAALAERPSQALQLCKRAIDLSFDLSEDQAIERSLALSAEAFALADCQEGVRAFFEKRPPRFTRS